MAEAAAGSQVARFGLFELDLRAIELRRAGVRLKLQEQPFRLLTFLLQRPGEIVTREELRTHLWPSEFVDFEHSLNTAIRKLRTALDDSADTPRFVETLPRRGYRFIAPVSWVGSADARRTIATPHPPSAPFDSLRSLRAGTSPLRGGEKDLDGELHPSAVFRSSPLRAVGRPSGLRHAAALPLFIGIATLAIVVAAFAWRGMRPAPPVPATPSIDAVAVLPFRFDTSASEHLGDGLTELLIDNLSRLPDLRVTARSTVFDYKGRAIHPSRVGQDLSVGALVTGVVRSDGAHHRIHVELIDTRDGAQIWGGRYEATPAELPAVQGRIAGDLSLLLRARLDPGTRHLASRPPTASAEAYQLYLEGLYVWNRRTRADVEKSIDYFTRAAQLDPQFAEAHAGIARAWGVLVGNGMVSSAIGAPRVLAAAQKALELDPANASAYVSLASTKFRNIWDFEGAERDYRRAIALNPNDATAHQWFSEFLRSMGRREEARREIDLAYALDPLSPAVNSTKCWSYYADRRYADAIAFSRRAAQVDSRFASHQCRVNSLMAMGDVEGAVAEMDPFSADNPPTRAIIEGYRRGGLEGMLRAKLKALTSSPEARFSSSLDIAETWALLGDSDRAFEWLEIACEQRVPRVTSFHTRPSMDRIRDDPRFAALARKIGIPPAALDGEREAAHHARRPA